MQLSGLGLARRYHDEVVAPLLAARWPGLRYACARLGSGSDVLALDDEMSRDHDWGLRLTLLVERSSTAAVDQHLERELPAEYRGWPTRFATTWDPVVRHRVQVATAEDFVASRLGVAVDRAWDAVDWLSLSGQSLLEVTAGEVFVDTLGALGEIRERLAWYPGDVWRYVVAADWHRIGQELPFVGRAGLRGDDLGSRVTTGHLVRVAMHLGFLLQRRWPPYSKWMGTMFAELPDSGGAAPFLHAALAAATWQERQARLVDALTAFNDIQRGAGLPVSDQVAEPFFDRPFVSVRPSVTAGLLQGVTDPLVRRLPPGVGSVEQWVDNVDVLTDPVRRTTVTQAWRALLLSD